MKEKRYLAERQLLSQIRRKENEINKLSKQEAAARKIWTREYHSYIAAAEAAVTLKAGASKRRTLLTGKIRGWKKRSTMLTKTRDEARARLEEARTGLHALRMELAFLKEERMTEIRATNEIVTQVFALNDIAVHASKDREEYLTRQVFPRLIDENGNVRSQITFMSSDGLKKVVALVNTMTIVRGDMAAEAKQEVEHFFSRFQETAHMSTQIHALYELTRQLLIEKTAFKVGPALYRFLAMELDEEMFPELTRAQRLLRQSIRSEKTNSYIRLYERRARTDVWRPVPQS